METIVDVFDSAWAQALGWTLIHSLWQGLLCFLLGVSLLRLLPSRRSGIRYGVSVGVFALLLGCSVVTFFSVYGAAVDAGADAYPTTLITTISNSHTVVPAPSYAQQIANWLTVFPGNHVGILAAVWAVGTMLFLLRAVSGYWYVGFIRRSAEPVGMHWQQMIDTLAARLMIRRTVSLAQSSLISAPVVLGYLKPVILVPVGMFSGLSTAQLEAIFIHELLHIRRNDYLINIIQTVLESLFFFNPFAWRMSALIRREREHCCDDGVVSHQCDRMAYVRALAALEEARLAHTPLALSLADDKNQLLNRIKRIMEKSVNHYSRRDRMIPAALLVVGLMCASWITITARDRVKSYDTAVVSNEVSRADTTVKEKTGTRYRYSITTVDDEGQEDTRVVDEYNGDVAVVVPPVHVAPVSPHVAIVVPRPSVVAPMIPPVMMHMSPVMAMRPFVSDTIPGAKSESWENIGREFEESFREKFSDFYQQHEKELKAMIDEFTQQLGDVESQTFFKENERQQEIWQRDLERMSDDFARRAEEMAERGIRMQELALNRAEDVHRLVEHMQIEKVVEAKLDEKMAKLDASLKRMEKRMQQANEEIRKEAIADGYLKEGEDIHTINIHDDEMEINGQKVKPSHLKKYRRIMDAAHKQIDEIKE